jgi:hypothetical protein
MVKTLNTIWYNDNADSSTPLSWWRGLVVSFIAWGDMGREIESRQGTG